MPAPIDAIVLDIGNVICEWNPLKLVTGSYPGSSSPSDDDVKQVVADTIEQQDWADLDRGTLELDEAIERAVARSSMAATWIESVYRNTPASLVPLAETIDAIKQVSSDGVPLYILSNMQKHAGEHLLREHDFFALFDHIVLSCDCGYVKPEASIYQHTIDVCQLNPATSVFIDDMAENVEGAIACGLQSVQMTDIRSGGSLIRQLLKNRRE